MAHMLLQKLGRASDILGHNKCDTYALPHAPSLRRVALTRTASVGLPMMNLRVTGIARCALR